METTEQIKAEMLHLQGDLKEAKTLLAQIKDAREALGEKRKYGEPELAGRYNGVWWALTMALNDCSMLVREWAKDLAFYRDLLEKRVQESLEKDDTTGQ